MSGRELFVYYRVAAADAARCAAEVAAFQARLTRDEPGLIARLLARPGAADGIETWMETYALGTPQGAGIDARLEARIADEAAALAPFLRGPRHVEVFVPRT